VKVPIENIYYLFCYAWDCLPESRCINVSSVPRPDTLNLFAHVIKTGTEHLLRRGLDRGYVAEKLEVSKIRGKIDFGESISALATKRLRLSCDFDEFVPDILHNQILRTTIRKLSQANGVDHSLRIELRKLDQMLTGIKPIQLEASAFRRVQVHRNNAFYGFLMRVCELLHSASLPDQGEDGRYAFREVLDDEAYMSVVFEKFVRRFYRIEQTEFPSVGRERLDWDAVSESAKEMDFLPSMNTDASLRSDSRLIVIDAKYYKDALQTYHEKRTVHSANLYQLMAYLHSAQKRWPGQLCEGILLYPVAASSVNLRYTIEGYPVRIWTLDLAQPWPEVRKALLELIRHPASEFGPFQNDNQPVLRTD
jgi:5-methylcytosine-specific restriction enzyme subunit McrC